MVKENTRKQVDFGEACWVLHVTINGVQLNMLIDTGANKTLIDTRRFKRCLSDFWDSVCTDTLKMVAANDTEIEVDGELELEFEVAGKAFPIMVTVA